MYKLYCIMLPTAVLYYLTCGTLLYVLECFTSPLKLVVLTYCPLSLREGSVQATRVAGVVCTHLCVTARCSISGEAEVPPCWSIR